ncbi:hypothetical protein AcW1_007235 [Taiwanofungus camphoratus]|nr:hypothetical protein AcW2_007698 [Antrodia cinnamomea]KAI0952869.1 hypothetical protein AcW1_007235 [Antrodia cinnamomea]
MAPRRLPAPHTTTAHSASASRSSAPDARCSRPKRGAEGLPANGDPAARTRVEDHDAQWAGQGWWGEDEHTEARRAAVAHGQTHWDVSLKRRDLDLTRKPAMRFAVRICPGKGRPCDVPPCLSWKHDVPVPHAAQRSRVEHQPARARHERPARE